MQVYESWTSRYASEPKAMRKGWLNLLGAPVFPRDIVLPIAGTRRKFQLTATSLKTYVELIEQHAPKGDVWAGWSATSQYDLPGMDRVFGDIDSPDLENALVRARRYEEWCMREFEVQPSAIFTVGKGFHLHMTHDFVEGLGTVYSDAFAGLIQGAGASPDLQTLKHRKTYPRVPYSMNLKATGMYRKPMFVVPVDLTWSLKDMLRASHEINVMPFEVPHSPVLGDLLRPAIEKAKRDLARRKRTPDDIQKGIHENLVQAALIFCESVGWRLVNIAGKRDGRRRLISLMYAPALMHDTGGDQEQAIASCEAWIELAGGEWRDYRTFVEGAVKDCIMRDGSIRFPVGLVRWWAEMADLKVGPEKRAFNKRD